MRRRFALANGLMLLGLTLLANGGAHAAFYGLFERQAIRLATEISYREDRGAQTPFEKVAAAAEGWTSQQSEPVRPDGRPVRVWARFDLPDERKPRRVLIRAGPWDSVEYYVVRDGVLIGRERTGSSVPQSERATRIMASSFLMAGVASVDIGTQGKTTVFARVAHDQRHVHLETLTFSLWDEAAARGEEAIDRLIQGIFLGAMLLLVAYNMAMFFVEGRDRSYLFYVVTLASAALGWLAYSGLAFEILWPEHPAWDRYAMWVANSVGMYALAQFARHYLDTASRLPVVDRQLNIVSLVFLVSPPALILVSLSIEGGPARDLERLQTLAFLWNPGALGIAILQVCRAALADKHPSARLFSIATACATAGSFVAMVPEVTGDLPALVYGHQVGFVLMGILLSIGMGFRMRQLRSELAVHQVEKTRLRRFLSPKVSELIASGQMDDPLATRRREVVVVFIDLRGFTAFSEVAAPEDVMRVLREYHAEVGRLVSKYEGTVEHFAGDGVMMTFNDPATLPDPALSGVCMAVELRDRVMSLAESWRELGFELGCGLGIAQGYATIGTIGFTGRFDYGVIGAVCNLAARLCVKAAAGQVLVSQRVYSRVSDKVVAESVGEVELKGFREPGAAYNVVSMKEATAVPQHAAAADSISH